MTGTFFLRNSNSSGPPDVTFTFGPGGGQPVGGDWNFDGSDGVGVYVASSGTFFLKFENSPGNADLVFSPGPAGLGYRPISGDWDGDGDDTAGLYGTLSGCTNGGGDCDDTNANVNPGSGRGLRQWPG